MRGACRVRRCWAASKRSCSSTCASSMKIRPRWGAGGPAAWRRACWTSQSSRITCAATGSSSAPARPWRARRSRASRVESRSSTRWTGTPKRSTSSRRKRRARRLVSCSLPSMLSGRPTTIACGSQPATRRATAFQSGSERRATRVPRGVAVPVRDWPTATPDVPASVIESEKGQRGERRAPGARGSRVAHLTGEPLGVDAQQPAPPTPSAPRRAGRRVPSG